MNINQTITPSTRLPFGQRLPRLVLSAIALAAILFSTGCASVVGGTHKKITFNSSPPGAQVTVHDEKGRLVAEGETPLVTKLRRGKPYFRKKKYEAVFTAEGYHDSTHQLTSLPNGWYMGNLIFGGLLGLLIVDPLTGAVYTLPNEVEATLVQNPTATSSATAPAVVSLETIPEEARSSLVPVK